MLTGTLERIIEEFPQAKQEEVAGHPFARFMEKQAADQVRKSMEERFDRLAVRGSASSGNWADIPWIAALDPMITDTPQRGYYVVYLINWRARRVALSLNQGSTQIRQELGDVKARTVLAERASWIRERLRGTHSFSEAPINLDAKTVLGRSYEPGHALGVVYSMDQLPAEGELRDHLNHMCALYERLTSLGGVHPIETSEDLEDVVLERPQATELSEKKQYRAHRRIERRPRVSAEVKRVHGFRCAACESLMSDAYGSVAANFIEAHHLVPISTLDEGVQFTFDVLADFCVLCPNCHRIIHRLDDPSDLDTLRRLLAQAKSGSM